MKGPQKLLLKNNDIPDKKNLESIAENKMF